MYIILYIYCTYDATTLDIIQQLYRIMCYYFGECCEGCGMQACVTADNNTAWYAGNHIMYVKVIDVN